MFNKELLLMSNFGVYGGRILVTTDFVDFARNVFVMQLSNLAWAVDER